MNLTTFQKVVILFSAFESLEDKEVFFEENLTVEERAELAAILSETLSCNTEYAAQKALRNVLKEIIADILVESE